MIRLLFALIIVSLLGPACIIITSDDTADDETGYADEGDPPSGADETGAQYCQIGSEGCACTTGGKCNDPFLCNNNLNICVADLCPVGTEACACTPQGACDPGLTCASDYCVDLGCPVGSEACPCTEGGACDPGLECFSGYCVDPQS